MEVSLPSGGAATFRDQFKGNDRMDALKAMQIVISPDGSRTMDSRSQVLMAHRIIRRTLVAWPFGALPSEAQSDDLAEKMLGELDDDDLQALEKAVGPRVQKILARDRLAFRHLASGLVFELANADDEPRARACPDFAALDDEPGPKTASPPTATSSSAVPPLPGPPTQT